MKLPPPKTVQSKILADDDKPKGDNTAVMAKIRQICILLAYSIARTIL